MEPKALFRAWDSQEKEWLFDFRIHPLGHVMKVLGEHEGKWQYSTEVLPGITLNRATGFTDRNGKEIFEGDIVRHHKYPKKLTLNEQIDLGWLPVVIWSSESDAEYGYWSAGFVLGDNPKAYEVVGNVFENPELLRKD